MHLLLAGLNHRSAPVEVRERFAIPEQRLACALAAIRESASLTECAILSTCNRTEVYAIAEESVDSLASCLCRYHGIALEDTQSHLMMLEGPHAAAHLLRVASGLDSLVLGEPQILKQVRDAFASATEAESAGPVLNALFRAAINAGKRARTETDIGRGGFSIGNAAVDLARSIFGSLNGTRILILGAGKMSELTARHMQAAGAQFIMVANRTFARAETVAARLGGEAIRYEEMADSLASCDVVISSTAAPHPIITRENVVPAMRRRKGRALFLIDIAVPRDVAPDVAALENVFLYDIDDLEAVVDDMARERQAEAHRVETIVQEETAEFMTWWRGLAAAPLVTQMRDKHEQFRQSELERLRNQLPDLSEHAWERIEAATKSLLTRVHRDPIQRLKAAASNGESGALLEAARQIFGLEQTEKEEAE